MYNLVALFIRYSGVITFVVFESIALFWAVRYNERQHEIYVTSANVATGVLYKRYEQISNYFSLSNINDSLAKENAKLLSQLEQSKFERSIQRDTIQDVEEKLQLYSYIAANVIDNSINSRENYLTIDVGTAQGIHQGMGVISKNGVVGIVKTVSKNFSQVLSVLNSQCNISASVRRTGFFGYLVWNGESPHQVTLEAIPKYSEIAVGDSIQTSGYSAIFPKGIYIGKVMQYGVKPGSNFYAIEVELANDLGNLEYVYVVDNLFRQELEQLEQQAKPVKGTFLKQ